MTRDDLLRTVTDAVREVEPTAGVVLFGSRARGDARSDSDWDFLILVDGRLTSERKQAIRRRLYDVELAADAVISSVIHSRTEWRSPRMRVTPLHRSVSREGIPA